MRESPLTQIDRLMPGDHCIFLYRDLHERSSFLASFFKIGIERNERCVALLDEDAREALASALDNIGIGVGEGKGRVCLLVSRETYSRDGLFDPARMCDFLKSAADDAFDEGYASLRFAGDLGWAAAGNLDRLMEYEEKITDIFDRGRLLGVCLYERRLFSTETMMEMLRLHPLFLHNGSVHKNILFKGRPAVQEGTEEGDELDGYIQGLVESEGLVFYANEKKGMEGRLRESEELCRRAFDNAATGMSLVGRDGKFLRVNRTLCDITGYSEAELLNMTFQDITPPEDLHIGAEIVARLLSGEIDTTKLEKRYIHKDGHTIWVSIVSALLRDPEGKAICFISQTLDITGRRRAEEELKEAKETYHGLFQNSQAGLGRTRVSDGRVLEANDKLAEIFGYDSREEFISEWTSTGAYVGKNNRKRLLEALARDGVVDNFEAIGRKKDGSLIRVRFSARLYPDKGYLDTVVVDITGEMKALDALKEREAALALSEQRYRNVVDNLKEIVFQTDAGGRWTLLNPAWTEVTGFSVDESLGQPFLEFIHPDDRERILSFFEPLIEGKKDFCREEIRYLTKDGGGCWIECFSRLALDADGNVAGVTGTLTDITERKLADEQLMESKDRFRSLVETTSDWVWEVDENVVYTYVSPKVKDLLGYEVEEVLGKTPFDLMPPDEAERVAAVFRPIAEKRRSFECLENANLHKDGRLVILETSGVPVFDKKGSLQGYRGIDRDITGRKRAEEEFVLLQTITQAITEADDFYSALGVTLRKVCEVTGWNFGEAWIPWADGSVLEYGTAWYGESGDMEKFKRLSEARTFVPGTGLPGRIWATKKPIWDRDVSIEPEALFPRVKMAMKAGLKAGFGVPILADGEVLAVLEFFMLEAREEDRHMVDLVSGVAAQLGSVIRRKRVEEKLLNKTLELDFRSRELHDLAIEMTTLEEKERKRFAGMLHDGIGQDLVAVKLGMGACMDRCDARDMLSEHTALLDNTIKTIRSMTAELYPITPFETGFIDAVRWYVGNVLEPSGVKVSLDIDETVEDLPGALKNGIYRVVQECLQNILKHSSASGAGVAFRVYGDHLRLSVKDDGTGFLCKDLKIGDGKGIGLILMRERVKSMGGTLTIRSQSGEGTEVLVDVPRLDGR